jgi:murein L,D-transpeptidase YafK
MRTLILLASLAYSSVFAQTFLRRQMAMPRVRAAFAEKDSLLRMISAAKGLPYPPKQIYVRAFKQEAMMEVWSKVSEKDSFVLLAAYPICASSGTAGPKLEAGDGQVPEGVYEVNKFNPQSHFLLSLGVSYPNALDRIRSAGKRTGGDIYIHGDCVTIGCLPLTDDKIKELYILAVRARSLGQRNIPIHIFPARLSSANYQTLVQTSPKHASLWTDLKKLFDRFETTHRGLNVRVTSGGYELR